MPGLTVADAQIEFEDTDSGVPLLLLHGFPATRHLWSEVAPGLAARGLRVIVPDLVGYGAWRRLSGSGRRGAARRSVDVDAGIESARSA